MSKYDNIKTAADLVAEVAVHGLSTEQDDINRAADIFGNTGIDELARLANDIGRLDKPSSEGGKPDPNGSWSSGRKGTQDTFYFIAFSIWNWREATSFFNAHTNPATKDHRVTNLETSLKVSERKCDDLKTQLDATAERAKNYANKIDDLNAEKATLELGTAKLKAKLYDLMVAAGN